MAKKVKKTNGKKRVLKSVEKLNRSPLKNKPVNGKSWLETYTATQNSAAKIVTGLLAQGSTVDKCSEVALAYSKKKGNTWGSKGNIKSHLKFLRDKGCSITEKDGIFKVS